MNGSIEPNRNRPRQAKISPPRRIRLAKREPRLQPYQQQLVTHQEELAESEKLLQQRSDQSLQLEQQVETLQRQATDHRVALARCEQRRDGLRRQTEQLHRDHEEHDRALQETRDCETESREQGQQLEQSVLTLSSELAEWLSRKRKSSCQATTAKRKP